MLKLWKIKKNVLKCSHSIHHPIGSSSWADHGANSAALHPGCMRIRFWSFSHFGGGGMWVWSWFHGAQKTPPKRLPCGPPPLSHTPNPTHLYVIGHGIVAGNILANRCNSLNSHCWCKQTTDSCPNPYIFFKEEDSCWIQVFVEDDHNLYDNSYVE